MFPQRVRRDGGRMFWADGEARIPDKRITSASLYQLSYIGGKRLKDSPRETTELWLALWKKKGEESEPYVFWCSQYNETFWGMQMFFRIFVCLS